MCAYSLFGWEDAPSDWKIGDPIPDGFTRLLDSGTFEEFGAHVFTQAVAQASGDGGLAPTQTVDTFEDYKIILLAQGNVAKAIPVTAAAPALPLNLAAQARLSSVKVTWSAAARASQYLLYKDGALLTTTSGISYRDRAISIGSTYHYQVQAVDGYGQRSAVSGQVTAFIDPELNVPPVVESVTAWPPNFRTGGKTYLRVNAKDDNAHALTLALGVSAGSIVATDDPSVWIYTP